MQVFKDIFEALSPCTAFISDADTVVWHKEGVRVETLQIDDSTIYVQASKLDSKNQYYQVLPLTKANAETVVAIIKKVI